MVQFAVVCCFFYPHRAPHNIQSQLSEVFKIIVYCDYPQQWPGLLEMLYNNLSAQVHGGLGAPSMCHCSVVLSAREVMGERAC